jgi:hypothetical protein
MTGLLTVEFLSPLEKYKRSLAGFGRVAHTGS